MVLRGQGGEEAVIGYNERDEAARLCGMLKRSRTWILHINAAIDVFKAKKAAQEEKDAAALTCLRIAQEVFCACMNERVCLDFMALSPSDERHVYDVLAAADVVYREEEDPLAVGEKKAPGAAQKAIAETYLAPALPQGANVQEYALRAKALMQVGPMYEAIGFAMEIVRGVRRTLRSFEADKKRAKGRDWKPLAAWKNPQVREKAERACREVCEKALTSRRRIPAFSHPRNPIQEGKASFLDVFDNQYTVVSEIAQAQTSPALREDGVIRMPTALLRGRMNEPRASAAPETLVLAAYMWKRMELLGIEESRRDQVWLSVGVSPKMMGVYGDRRIAASGFINAVQSDISHAEKPLLRTMSVGGVLQVCLTRAAADALSGKKRALSPCAILGARMAAYLRESGLEADTPVRVSAQKGEDGISVPVWLYDAAREELSSQSSLNVYEAGEASFTAALTEGFVRRMKTCAAEKSFLKIPGLTPAPEGTQGGVIRLALPKGGAYVLLPQDAAPMAEMEAKEDASQAGEAFSQYLDVIAKTAVMRLEAHEEKTIELLRQKEMAAQLLPAALGCFAWPGDEAVKKLFDWLEETALFDRVNEPYAVLYAYMKEAPGKKRRKNAPEAVSEDEVDKTIWDAMQGRNLSDEAYAEAVWRIVRNAGVYMQRVLQCGEEIKDQTKLEQNDDYRKKALSLKAAKPIDKKSNTWWMTRVMRLVLACTYAGQEEALSPEFEESAAYGKDPFAVGLSGKEEENVRGIRDAISEKLAGVTWEELNRWKKDQFRRAPEEEALRDCRKAFYAFCKKSESSEYSVQVIPSPNKKKYAFRVSLAQRNLPEEIRRFIQDPAQEDSAWMEDAEKRRLFVREAKEMWLGCVSAWMRRQRLKEGEKTGRQQSIVTDKTHRLLSLVFACAMDGCGDARATAQPYVRGRQKGMCGFTLEAGEKTYDFDAMCACLFSLRGEGEAAFIQRMREIDALRVSVKPEKTSLDNTVWLVQASERKDAEAQKEKIRRRTIEGHEKKDEKA